MRKRIFWVMPLAAAIVLCLFTAPGVHAARGVSADTIKMGLIMVKTGPVAAMGNSR